MKRDQIEKARELNDRLRLLEHHLAYFEAVKRIVVVCEERLEFQDYPPPSDIGAAFFKIRAAICQMLEAQIAELKKELSKMGVDA